MSSPGPPPLPPRKPSPSPAADRIIFDSPLERREPSLASAPPPLPPRKSGQLPPPIIIDGAPGISSLEDTAQSNTSFMMNVTPATPATPVQATPTQLSGVEKKDFAADAPVEAKEEAKGSMPLGSYQTAMTEQLKSAVPYLPDPNRQTTVSIEWLAVTAVLVLLAYLRLSLLWIVILGAVAAAWLYKASIPKDIGDGANLGGAGSGHSQEREAVSWV